jgi:uncharacterized protein
MEASGPRSDEEPGPAEPEHRAHGGPGSPGGTESPPTGGEAPTGAPPTGADPRSDAPPQGYPPPGGAPHGQPPPYAPPPPAPLSPQDARNLAMLTHLSGLISLIGLPSFVGPMIVWLVNREKDPFVDGEGKEALNFNLSVLIYAAVGGLLAFVAAIFTLGLALFLVIPIAIGAGIAWFVFVILAAIQASKGQPYRYPLTIRMIR